MQNEKLFMEALKIAMDEVRESTLKDMLEKDDGYKAVKKAAAEAEAAYIKLHLSEEQKSVLDRFLDFRSKEDYEYALLSYMAGIRDGIRIIKLFKE